MPDATVIDFRTVRLADAGSISKLAAESRVLDENSHYCYLLLCRDFAETCVVGCRGSEVVGFVTAYRPPNRPDVIFVWQIGVAEASRGQGLATGLLSALIAQPACRSTRFLEATVTPSNTASRRLFESFAKTLQVPCSIEEGFTAAQFNHGTHEEEELYRIGPLPASL